MPADRFTMSPSLTFVKQVTWIGQGLLRLMRPRSRSLRSIFLIGASICMELLKDPVQFLSEPPSPAAFRPAGVYNENDGPRPSAATKATKEDPYYVPGDWETTEVTNDDEAVLAEAVEDDANPDEGGGRPRRSAKPTPRLTDHVYY